MQNKEMLDREVESQELLDLIDETNENNQIILLTGTSGVGKSGLVEKLSQNPDLKETIITIKISKTCVDSIENLQYFDAIYKKVSQYAKSNACDQILSPTQQGVKSFKNVSKVAGSMIKSKMGLDGALPISEPEDTVSVIRKKQYLKYILSSSNIILDIENIQNIDTQSFEILKDLINDVSKRTFILEYTLSQVADTNHFKNFYKELTETKAKLHWYNVNKMDFSIAKKLAPNNIYIDDKQLEALYDSSDGNLMEIILANEQVNKNISNISVKLNTLSKNEKYVLYIFFLNNESLSYYELATITIAENSKNVIKDFEQLKYILNELCAKKILVGDEDDYRIKHDSILNELHCVVPNPILQTAYVTLVNYYNNKLSELPKAIEKLLSLYLKFSDPQLLLILPKIKQLILDIKYPDLIISKLEQYRKELINQGFNSLLGSYSLTLMMVEICLQKKKGCVAQEYLNLIYDETNSYHLALQAQIYSLQENIVAHNKLSELVNNTPSNSRLRLICEICLLYSKTKLQTTSETKNYGLKLINNSAFYKYAEYAFLLRNYAELCDSTEECKHYYFSALKIFKKHKMYHDMASVYISLSMIVAYEGDISLSNRYIDKALELDSRDLSLCYVYNNQATLCILGNNISNEVEKRYKDALLLSVTKYEKLLIKANLLVYYCITNDFRNAKPIADSIENSNYSEFKYEEFLHIIYQNLYYYYSTFNHNHVMRDYYYKQIMSLINDPTIRESTKFMAQGMNNLIKTDNFFHQFPYRVDFLGYWEFIIDSDLNYYE